MLFRSPLGISSFIESVTRSHAATGIGTFTSIENTSAIRSYVGSGLIDVTGGYNPYDDYGLITLGITGQYVDYGFLVDYTSYYDDYGPLSTLGTFGFIEKTTKSYNRSSIEVDQTSSDYGLVSASVDTQDDLGGLPGTLVYDDYGSISSIFDSSFIDDYGSITASTTYEDYGTVTTPVTVEGVFGVVADYGSLATPLTPFGTITISGGSVDDLDVKFTH